MSNHEISCTAVQILSWCHGSTVSFCHCEMQMPSTKRPGWIPRRVCSQTNTFWSQQTWNNWAGIIWFRMVEVVFPFDWCSSFHSFALWYDCIYLFNYRRLPFTTVKTQLHFSCTRTWFQRLTTSTSADISHSCKSTVCHMVHAPIRPFAVLRICHSGCHFSNITYAEFMFFQQQTLRVCTTNDT